MKHRVGVKRIAKQAGVSIATVDRVLNERPGVSVRPATVQKVLEAVKALSGENVAQLLGEPQIRQESLKLALLIQAGAGFNTRLQYSLQKLQSTRFVTESISIEQNFTSDLNPDLFAERLLKTGKNSDGVILACQDTPTIRDAVNALTEQGHPVVCVTTDLPTSRRLAYVGMDQYRAGRAAGTLIGRFSCGQPGEVLLIVSGSFRCQQEREIGFRQVLRESFPQLTISESLQSGDANDVSYRQAQEFLCTERRLLAVYNVSGGNQGILQAVRECEYLPQRPIYVCHDLTPNTRRSVLEGQIDAVIDYDAEQALSDAVQRVLNFHHPNSYLLDSEPLAIRICMADTV